MDNIKPKIKKENWKRSKFFIKSKIGFILDYYLQENNKIIGTVHTDPDEKKVEEQLLSLGINTYCPTRTEIKIWSDRKKRFVNQFYHQWSLLT